MTKRSNIGPTIRAALNDMNAKAGQCIFENVRYDIWQPTERMMTLRLWRGITVDVNQTVVGSLQQPDDATK